MRLDLFLISCTRV